MLELAKVGRMLLGVESGIALLLFFLGGIATWAYWRERKRNNEIQEERLADAREDVKAMTASLMEAKNAIDGFKNTLDVVAAYLREGAPCPYRANRSTEEEKL